MESGIEVLDDLTVILPTFNERQNLEILVPQILKASWCIPSQNVRLMVVDDNS